MNPTLQKISTLENFQASGGASESQILSLQEEFQIKLPEDYIEFLSTYGSCLWFGESILGIGSGPFKDMFDLDSRSHIAEAQSRVKRLKTKIKTFIPVDKYEAGGYYLLTEDGVILIDDETPHIVAEKHCGFTEYLKTKIR